MAGTASLTHLQGLTFGSLLAPMSCEEFLERYWGNSPVHITGEASKFSFLFGFRQLTEALERADPRRVTVRVSFDRGATQVVKPPSEALGCYGQGATLCIQGLESVSDGLAAITTAVRNDLRFSGSIDIRVYLSPDGQGFESHFDRRIATTLQIEGSKLWRFSEQPALEWPHYQVGVDGTIPLDRQVEEWDQFKSAKECSFREVALQPGDVLCLPAGCWHSAAATGHSLALNLTFETAGFWGVLGPTIGSVLQRVPTWRCPPPPILSAQSPDGDLPAAVREYLDTRIADLIAVLGDLRSSPEALYATWMRSCGATPARRQR